MINGPLKGINVVDLTTMISGPMATSLLADQGADVIKVESPSGDLVRRMGQHGQKQSATFLAVNRGKRSVVIDLKSDAGTAALARLVERADVFVQNFRPGTIDRMGFGESVVREINPTVIYASISGFGLTGPMSHKRVYDPLIQALSGLAAIQRNRETGRPQMIRTIIPDKLTAMMAAQAISAALVARAGDGKGQHVQLSMLDAMVTFLWPEGHAHLTFPRNAALEAPRQLSQDLVYETADGYMTVGAVSDAEWQGLCEALDRCEWLVDDRFNTPTGRVVNAPARLQQTQEVLAMKSTDHWLEKLDEHGVPCAPIISGDELLSHPQVEANKLIETFDHPLAGLIRQPRPAATFSGTPAGISSPAPKLGEHTAQVVNELGLDQEHRSAILERSRHAVD